MRKKQANKKPFLFNIPYQDFCAQTTTTTTTTKSFPFQSSFFASTIRAMFKHCRDCYYAGDVRKRKRPG